MEDPELEKIRQARLAQLQAEAGNGGDRGSGNEGREKQEAEMRQTILGRILCPEAADRLGRIRLVKESRATDIENRLIMMAQTGQLRGKVTEEQLKQFLNAVHEKEEEKIVINRRTTGWDDDDDLLDL